jgi:hypothetical protein
MIWINFGDHRPIIQRGKLKYVWYGNATSMEAFFKMHSVSKMNEMCYIQGEVCCYHNIDPPPGIEDMVGAYYCAGLAV